MWLDGQLLGSFTGSKSVDEINVTYSLPESLKSRNDSTLTVLIDNMGARACVGDTTCQGSRRRAMIGTSTSRAGRAVYAAMRWITATSSIGESSVGLADPRRTCAQARHADRSATLTRSVAS